MYLCKKSFNHFIFHERKLLQNNQMELIGLACHNVIDFEYHNFDLFQFCERAQ